MSDLERLDEALGNVDLIHSFLNVPDGKAVVAAASLIVVSAAARAYRDLLANGEQVEWCEVHRLPMSDPSETHEKVCAVFYFAGIDPDECRIAPKLLVDPTTEEER